jgi:hypothetical protein
MEILAMAKEKVQDVGGLMLGCHPRSSDPFVLDFSPAAAS